MKHAMTITISGPQGSGKSKLAEGIVDAALGIGLAVDHKQEGLFIGGSQFAEPNTPRVLIEEIQSPTVSHTDMVRVLKKPGEDILSQLTPGDCDLLHMGIGVAGEAGELLDAIKRPTIYRKPLDRESVVEELGDIEFFLEGIRQRLGITREETLQANIEKLGVRYQGLKYGDQAAQDRADKVA